MWINGKEMVGEVLEKNKAREIYNSYKQTRRDPGLLEQVDYKTFEMRVFPIAPRAEQKVQVVYYQELDVDHDWATLRLSAGHHHAAGDQQPGERQILADAGCEERSADRRDGKPEPSEGFCRSPSMTRLITRPAWRPKRGI